MAWPITVAASESVRRSNARLWWTIEAMRKQRYAALASVVTSTANLIRVRFSLIAVSQVQSLGSIRIQTRIALIQKTRVFDYLEKK